MATLKQKRLARAIVENATAEAPLTAGELLENVGYAPTVAKHKPGEMIEREGVQEELRALGFTEDNAKRVVAEILDDGSADRPSRLKAADMIFKVHGSYAPERHANLNVNIDTNVPVAAAVVDDLEKELRAKLLNA